MCTNISGGRSSNANVGNGWVGRSTYLFGCTKSTTDRTVPPGLDTNDIAEHHIEGPTTRSMIPFSLSSSSSAVIVGFVSSGCLSKTSGAVCVSIVFATCVVKYVARRDRQLRLPTIGMPTLIGSSPFNFVSSSRSR